MTLGDYFGTPETVLPQELAYGEWHVADAPLVSHQRVVLKLAMALEEHVSKRSLGEVFVAPIDVVLDAERALVVQPDLLFVSRRRAHIVLDRIFGAPDLVVEVLSPHPRIGKIDQHVRWFAKHGVREIWMYDQSARRMDVLSCEQGHLVSRREVARFDRIHSAVLPDLDQTLGALIDV